MKIINIYLDYDGDDMYGWLGIYKGQNGVDSFHNSLISIHHECSHIYHFASKYPEQLHIFVTRV